MEATREGQGSWSTREPVAEAELRGAGEGQVGKVVVPDVGLRLVPSQGEGPGFEF